MPVVVISVVVKRGIIWVPPEAWLLPIVYDTDVSPTIISNVVCSKGHISTAVCRKVPASRVSNVAALRSLRSVSLMCLGKVPLILVSPCKISLIDPG